MKNVSITERFALCMLKEVKHFNYLELSTHLLVSMIIEMKLSGCLEIIDYNEGKVFKHTGKIKVKLNNKEPDNEYNKELYYIIKEIDKSEPSISDIITFICFGRSGFSDKKLKNLVGTLKEQMLNNKLISLENKKGLLRNKEVIVVNEDKFKSTIREIRTKLLEEVELEDDYILLASLLNSSDFLKNIFIKYEKDILNTRIKEIKNTEIYKQVRIAQEVVDDYNSSMIL